MSGVTPFRMAALAARLAGIIGGLCRATAARSVSRQVPGPILVLIWNRLQRLAARFATLATRAESGGVLPVRCRRAALRARRPREPGLPESLGWLIRLVPETAQYGGQFRHLLSDPDMAELLAAAPQAGRILRPLCRMLAVRPLPENLKRQGPRVAARIEPRIEPGIEARAVTATAAPAMAARPSRLCPHPDPAAPRCRPRPPRRGGVAALGPVVQAPIREP